MNAFLFGLPLFSGEYAKYQRRLLKFEIKLNSTKEFGISNIYTILCFIGNSDGVKTLTLELYFAKLTSGQYGNPWQLIFPAVFVTIIPIIILYIFLQKYIIKGVADGAVK